MQSVSRNQTRQMMDEKNDLVVIEALSEESFNDFHLPNAVNVPLNDDFAEEIQQTIPDKETPVLVYCMDAECHASEKAGQKMEELGYANVFDYEAGKMDWKEAGLPISS
ncbi:MAG: hypothetical protein CMJ46_08000 [Planctomyces sp.]|nr:hypothetical protein [Planctomyces sp.]